MACTLPRVIAHIVDDVSWVTFLHAEPYVFSLHFDEAVREGRASIIPTVWKGKLSLRDVK